MSLSLLLAIVALGLVILDWVIPNRRLLSVAVLCLALAIIV